MSRRALTFRTTFLGLAVALLAACGDVNTGPDPVAIEDTKFASELGIDLSRMERATYGTYYEDVVIGTGDVATAGDSILVHWKLWLPDGTLIETSRLQDEDGDGEPDEEEADPHAIWLVSAGPFGPGVIDGWVDGVPGMQVGGTRKLAVPWQLAYGATQFTDKQGNIVIPSYANLVFEIELFGVTEVDESAIF